LARQFCFDAEVDMTNALSRRCLAAEKEATSACKGRAIIASKHWQLHFGSRFGKHAAVEAAMQARYTRTVRITDVGFFT